MYATFDKPVTASGKLPASGRDAGYVKFDTTADKTVTMRIATSLISVDQARQEPRARDRAGRHVRGGRGARAAAVGPQARRDRGRGRDRRPADDAVLEPLPPQPLSELRVREHRHGGEPGLQARGAVVVVVRDPAEHARRETGAPRRPRQGLRQQRVLGHLPHDVAGLRAAVPDRRRRAGGRLRPAVPRRRLGRALVVAGLREPDDRHELRRRVRRRLPEGRAQLRREGRLRRRAEERDGGAAGLRPERHERRPQGPPDRALPRLHADSVGEGVSWALEGDINDFGIANMAEAAGRRPGRAPPPSGGATRRSPSTSSSARATT